MSALIFISEEQLREFRSDVWMPEILAGDVEDNLRISKGVYVFMAASKLLPIFFIVYVACTSIYSV